MNNKIVILVISLFIIILICCGILYFVIKPAWLPGIGLLSNTSLSSAEELTPCWSDQNSKIVSLRDKNIVTEMEFCSVEGNSTECENITGSRSIPLSRYKDGYKGNYTEDLIYSAEPAYGEYLPKIDYMIQVCDQNNMTKKSAVKSKNPNPENLTSGESTGFYGGLKFNYYPIKTDTYRIDGYTYFEGTWYLTNRIEEVSFTE